MGKPTSRRRIQRHRRAILRGEYSQACSRPTHESTGSGRSVTPQSVLGSSRWNLGGWTPGFVAPGAPATGDKGESSDWADESDWHRSGPAIVQHGSTECSDSAIALTLGHPVSVPQGRTASRLLGGVLRHGWRAPGSPGAGATWAGPPRTWGSGSLGSGGGWRRGRDPEWVEAVQSWNVQ